MTPDERAKKRAEEFAAKHAVMEMQREARKKDPKRGLLAGDFIRVDTGGPIKRLAYDAHSAGECLQAAAEIRAMNARKEHDD